MAFDKSKLTGVSSVYPLKVSPYEQYMGDFENPSVVSKINSMIQTLLQMGRLTNQTVAQWNSVMDWIVNGGMDEIATDIATEKVEVALNEVMRMLDVSLNSGLKDLATDVTDKKISELLSSGQFDSMISESLVEINEVVEGKLEGFAGLLAEKVKNEDNNLFFNPQRVKNGLTNTQMGNIRTQDVYNLYDEFIDNKYVTKTLLGKDQSDLFELFTYEFTPKKYTKKLIITASIHGNGVSGDPRDVTIGLYYFLKQLMDNNNKDKHLNFIRNKVKLIVIPIMNPWGYDNASRYNSRGVDLCRNFPYGWDSYVDTYGNRPKGASAVSEKESQYLKAVLDANPDADAYIDYHAWMNTGLTFGYEYADDADTTTANVAFNLSDHLIRKYGLTQTQMSQQVLTNEPTPGRYASKTLKIPSGNPEFYVYVTDLPNREEEIWTRMVEWYGNFIYLYAFENLKLNVSDENSSMSTFKHLWYRYGDHAVFDSSMSFSSIIPAGTGTVVENNNFAYEFTSGVDGMAVVTMRLNVRNTTGTETAQSFLSPILYQVGGTDFNETTPFSKMQSRWEAYWEGSQRFPLTLQAIIPVKKSGGKIHVGLGGYVSEGVAQIYRYTCIVEVVANAKSEEFNRRNEGLVKTSI